MPWHDLIRLLFEIESHFTRYILDQMWNLFTKHYNDATNKFIPDRKMGPKKKPSWMKSKVKKNYEKDTRAV